MSTGLVKPNFRMLTAICRTGIAQFGDAFGLVIREAILVQSPFVVATLICAARNKKTTTMGRVLAALSLHDK